MSSLDHLAKCIADFSLVDAKPSESWEAYFAQRHTATLHYSGDSDGGDSENSSDSENGDSDDSDGTEVASVGDGHGPIYNMMDFAVDQVLVSTKLEDAVYDVIRDAIFVLYHRVQDDGDLNVRSASVLSRIFSPTNPTAIDVYLDYHHRTRTSSVEYSCSIYFRVHDPVSGTRLARSTPDGRRKMHGFRPLLQMGLKDMPPGPRWRAVEQRKFNVSAAQARTLHRVLFGSAGLVEKISVKETMLLLLASVGIALHVAESTRSDSDRLMPDDLHWDGRSNRDAR
ncbi:hypothetical protein B0H11DRAFT_469184 [Mycena galericulata]|nr:hypothetical protein B0H11DRAFT_469184 [Mycena galericulata]